MIEEAKRVRVICKRDLVSNMASNSSENKNKYVNAKSVPYNIPIARDGERFITGQDLSYKQMIGEEAMSKEEQQKYPFVINPDKVYKIRHLTWLNKDDPYQKCMIDLLLITGKWAESKILYEANPIKYDGYLEDPISEAVAKNVHKDDRYEAETCIRAASMERYPAIALMLNFLSPNININVNLAKDVVLQQLYDVCDTNPKIVKMCFAKYNKGVDKDIFLLECMHYNILKRTETNDIWNENDYIGKTLEDVKRYLGKKENEHLYSKFQNLLDQAQGKTVANINKIAADNGNVDKDILLIMQCKTAIFDKDYERAMAVLGQINKDKNKEEYNRLSTTLSEMKEVRESSKGDAAKEKFLTDLNAKDLIDLQKLIENKLTKYKKEDCSEFWDNSEKLKQYIIGIKFPVPETV